MNKIAMARSIESIPSKKEELRRETGHLDTTIPLSVNQGNRTVRLDVDFSGLKASEKQIGVRPMKLSIKIELTECDHDLSADNATTPLIDGSGIK